VLIGIAPKTYRYATSRGDDSEFRERLHRRGPRLQLGDEWQDLREHPA
jgi:hypothetical protein